MSGEYESLDMVIWMKEWDKSNLSDTEKRFLLKRLFKYQIKRLEGIDCDCIIAEGDKNFCELVPRSIYRLSKMQHVVINKAMEIGRPGLIPFLPVLPRKVIDTFHLVMRLYNSGENWYPAIHFNKVDMGKETSPHNAPYFIFNIDQGFSTLGLSPNDSRIKIAANKFHAMNLAEVLADQMHTDILKLASVHGCKSTYRENKKSVPDLYIDPQGNFGLKWSDINMPKPGFISPSYQEDMVAISWRMFISLKAWKKWKKRTKKQRVITPI